MSSFKEFLVGLILLITLTSCKSNLQEQDHPNILIIYMDDLGYGDVSANGASQIETPNIDKLMNGGVNFKSGYATSATCTPSRYALLTGTYPWRNRAAKILPGTAPLLIDTSQTTLPKLLRDMGYYTGIVGKWHLGLGYGHVNWNKKISPGPYEIGFDYSYIMAATQDRVPTVYIENGVVDGLEEGDPIEVNYESNFPGEPTGLENPELLSMNWHHQHNNSIVNGIPRIGFMKGGNEALWRDTDMADHFLNKVKSFIDKHSNKSFFLYYALQQPHVPRTPNPRFVGRSGMGPRGDVILEADWCVGQLISHLNKHDILENTLIIFTSDNGPVLNDGYIDNAEELIGDHEPTGPFRGGKYSLYEAGTRVPFSVYWKGTIKTKVTHEIISQVDIMSSLANLVGYKNEFADSQNLLELMLGKSNQGRANVVIEAMGRTAYRKGDYVLIPAYGGNQIFKNKNIELGNSDTPMLFNLINDPSQENNLAQSNEDLLEELQDEYSRIISNEK